LKAFLKNHLNKLTVAVALVAAVLAIAPSGFPPSAQAATPNVAISNPGVMLIPLHISGQYTTTVSSVSRFSMPMPCDLVGVAGSARFSHGNSPLLNVDLKAGGVSVLSAPFYVSSSAVSEGTIATAAIADEATMTVDFGLGGTSPAFYDVTVLLTCVRK